MKPNWIAKTVIAAATTAFVSSAGAAELQLRSLKVKNPIKAGQSYVVTIPYRSTGAFKVVQGCFLWSGEGPYCFPVKVGRKSITARLQTNNPNRYRLSAYVIYRDHPSGKKNKNSNRVSAPIKVVDRSGGSNKATALNTVSVADIKCVQQGLLDAGHEPRGIDGKIGGGTRKAASAFLESVSANLSALSSKSAPEWCRYFQAQGATEKSKIVAGQYRAVFSSSEQKNGKRFAVNRCGILEIDYQLGHFYRYGLCNEDRSDIATSAAVWQTALVSVTDRKIKVQAAKYDIVDVSKDQLIGEWTLNGVRNPVLVFKKM